MFGNPVQLPKIYLVVPESKIYIIVNIVANSLRTVVYIILRKIFKAGAFLIIENSSISVAATFVCTIFMIKFDEKKF